MPTPLTEWTRLLCVEYLANFIPSGGAAVKFAVAPEEQVGAVMAETAEATEANGFITVRVDAAQTKVSMVDKVFLDIARQVNWDSLCEAFLRTHLPESGIHCPADHDLRDIDSLAEINGQSKNDLLPTLERLITNLIIRDYTLGKEFRIAMAMLCRSYYSPQNVSPSDADVVKEWLTGEKCSMASLKRLQINQRVSRHNARLLLASLARWTHKTGHAGLALLLDINAAVSTSPSPFNLQHYSRAAVLDLYEVLRQFIDETDEVAHLLVVVIAGPGLVEEQNVRKNYRNYHALEMRIIDEVRDERRANPLNALVKVTAGNYAAGGEA